ncbi:MAG: EamA family transporter [Polaribacter sp.]|nr:EamA family transporter [Polaribacter sp.]MDG1810395.1 EamA family transporter [Polaribacter sp.]MDG1994314.1 EamA family transporter [Polaribacter sp.]
MFYILISILLFSFNNVLWKKNLKNTAVYFLISYRSFITSFLSIGAMLFIVKDYSINFESFLRVSAGSFLGVVGLLTMLVVIKKTSLQWLGIYNLVGIFITLFYLYFFENLQSFPPITGITFIILGYALFIFFNQKSKVHLTFKYHLLLIIMICSFNFSYVIHWKNLTQEIHPLLIISNQEVLVFMCSSFLLFLREKKSITRINYKNHFNGILLMSIVILFAVLFSFLGIQATDPLITAILFLVSPLTTILFSYIFFKEQIILKHIISISIISVGVFIIHYHSL